MRIFIATESRIHKIGNDYYVNNSLHKTIERYYKAFGSVTICTRIVEIEKEQLPVTYEYSSDIIDDAVAISRLEDVALGKYSQVMEREIENCSLVIARVPSIVAYHAATIARKKNIPYLTEVVGCAWDSYWNYSIKSKIYAVPFFLMMRKAVKQSNYATYVTEKFLQKRYPCNCPSIHASNVIINCAEEGIIERRIEKISNRNKNRIVLLTAAAIDVAYKGQEYVIRAIKELIEKGLNVEYRLAGNGDSTRLKTIAAEYGVENKIVFLGALPREGVMLELDNCDIYIQPSLQEGLPRSLIEAMSRGCPSLGARTAGIPELIAEECVFNRADPKDTARAIEQLNNSDMREYAYMNYRKAAEYDFEILEKRRNDFYNRIISEISNK